MIDPSPETGAAAERGGASWRHMGSVLTSPGEGFAALARKPTFALVMVLLVVVGAVGVWIAMSKVTAADLFASIEQSGRAVPAKMQEDPEAFLKVMRATQLGTVIVLSPLFYLALAGICLVAFRMLGSDLTFRQSLATTVHALLPFGLVGIAGIAIAFGRDEIRLADIQAGGLVPSHLGVLAGEDAGKVLRALLGSFDLFSVWCVVLLATGYRVVARVSRGAAWGVVGTVWTIGILIKLAIAAIF